MKKKLVGIFVLMLFITTFLPVTGAMNKNNELKDVQWKEKQDLEFKFEIQKISYSDNTECDEGFEDGVVPPADWALNDFSDSTWVIDPCYKHSGDYSASCFYDEDLQLQNEWLITPEMNFSSDKYYKIYLYFWWSMDYYYAVEENNFDLNVSILINESSDWKLLWNEHEVGEYQPYIWQNTTNGNELDLSEYLDVNNTKVKIAFQYNGSNGSDVSIDDIQCWGIPKSPVKGDAGGPYDGWSTERIYFQGTADGGKKPYKWFWNFGDGTNSTLQNPKHKYANPSNYTVTLTVMDANNNYGYDETYAVITPPPHPRPQIVINDIPLNSIGVKAKLQNTGNYNASNIEWEIIVTGGILNILYKNEIGTISNLAISESIPIRTKYFLGFGFGKIDIKIQADPEFGWGCVRECSAYKFGPFILNINSILIS